MVKVALNVFRIKSYAALFAVGFLPTIAFYIGTMYHLLVGLACFLVASIVGILIGRLILKNPFTEMLEGSGIMTFHIDSTGIIRPFIMKMAQPFVRARIGNALVEDVYDRETVLQMTEPITGGTFIKQKTADGKDYEIDIKITTETFNKTRFAMFQYPVLLYNGQIKSLVTKEFLSSQEKVAFSEHGILYLNRKMEDLTSAMLNFGRYIVDLSKPKSDFLKSKWFMIIIIAVVIFVMVALGWPLLKQLMGSGGGSMLSAMGGIFKGGGAVVPQ